MDAGNALLAVLIFGVSTLLGSKSSRVAQVLLFASALLVSGLLFLPGTQLVGVVGVETVAYLEGQAARTPWSLPNWVHFLVFGWLGFLLWMCRPDLRGWKAWGLLALLAASAELAQVLVPDRESRLHDVLLNLVGGASGLLLAILFLRLLRPWRRLVPAPGADKHGPV